LKREEKERQITWLHEELKTAKALFLTDFQGLSVSEMNALRSELRNRGIKFKVLKNTLARLAYKDTDVSVLGPDRAGPRAAAWTDNDDTVPIMAKVLTEFAKTHQNLGLIRGMLNGKTVNPSDMETLSKLPSREELLGRLLGQLMAPVSSFVNVLAAVPRSLLNVLKAIEEQKASPSEAQSLAD
jgi:large subunit ribosomal protein L10